MFRLPALAAAALALAAPSAAQPTGRPIEVIQPWSRPAVAGSTGVGYMTLVNLNRAPVALVAAESPLARKVEIHSASMAGGIMRMAPQASVSIPPNATVRFAPGGYHLMFLGLKRPLAPGDQLPAVLRFSDGRRVSVAFRVGTGAEPAPRAQLEHQVRPTSAK